jgi:hypothetical protein
MTSPKSLPMSKRLAKIDKAMETTMFKATGILMKSNEIQTITMVTEMIDLLHVKPATRLLSQSVEYLRSAQVTT